LKEYNCERVMGERRWGRGRAPRRSDGGGGGGDSYKKLYAVLSYLGVFTFCRCCFLICLVCFVASFKFSCVYLLLVECVYCWTCLVCVVILCVFVVLCVYCCFYFRCRTAG